MYGKIVLQFIVILKELGETNVEDVTGGSFAEGIVFIHLILIIMNLSFVIKKCLEMKRKHYK